MFSSEFKASKRALDRRWFQNFVVRVFQCTLVFVMFCVVTAATWSHWNDFEPVVSWLYWFFLGFWGFTLAWNSYQFFHLFRKPGLLHPGWSVGFDLFASLGYAFCAVISVPAFTWEAVLQNRCSQNRNTQYGEPNAACLGNEPLHVAGITLMTFGGFALVFTHFYLFIRSCIDTHRIRHGRSLGSINDIYSEIEARRFEEMNIPRNMTAARK